MEDTESRSMLEMSAYFRVHLSTILFGGTLFFVGYIVSRLLRTGDQKDSKKNVTESQRTKSEDHTRHLTGVPGAGQTGSSVVSATSGKRAKNKKRREAQQEFTHSWMVGALKGHTAPVLDMNFSSNGKFLASCAEDCGLRFGAEVLDPGEEAGSITKSSSSSKSNSTGYSKSGAMTISEVTTATDTTTTTMTMTTTTTTTTAPPPSTPPTPPVPMATDSRTSPSAKEERAILSRRQRKNRTRAPRDQRRERVEDEDEQPEQEEQQQLPPRHHRHHLRQQRYQKSPTRSADPELSSSPVSGRNGASLSFFNQSQNETYQSDGQNGWVFGKSRHAFMNNHRNERQHESYRDVLENNRSSRNMFFSYRGELYFMGSHQLEVHQKNTKNGWRYGVPRNICMSTQREGLYHLSDATLANLLRRYIPPEQELINLGYPSECEAYPGDIVIINNRPPRVGRGYNLDVNAREFVPGSGHWSWTMAESEADSGHCSGGSVESSDLEPESSSDSDKSSDIGESTSSSSSSSSSLASSIYEGKSRRGSAPVPLQLVTQVRQCARCHGTFYVNGENGEYLNEEPCVYHWGKIRNGLHNGYYDCCGACDNSHGCTSAKTHVWTGLVLGCNGPYKDYVRTRPAGTVPPDGNYGVYALDCEMCFTKRGLEVAKVTFVGMDGVIIYDTLVKPDVEVIDYNTRFSGITAEDLAKASKSLRDVQMDILSFVHAETILIGHGLENDLRALRIFHTSVIDTGLTYPHFLGHPFRRSLKNLAKTFLGRDIQMAEHDSVEDARVAVDLILHKLQEDLS